MSSDTLCVTNLFTPQFHKKKYLNYVWMSSFMAQNGKILWMFDFDSVSVSGESINSIYKILQEQLASGFSESIYTIIKRFLVAKW